ncbi:hypothetical protein CEP53_004625 [Fusarium sp. AF-6]|nr:hypothetical protein CEP53_004625 [Fusarium sp. AF-6]
MSDDLLMGLMIPGAFPLEKLPEPDEPHEPIDRELEFRIRNCIQPVWSKKELRDKHIEDQDATWFAVEDDLSTGTPNSAKKFLRLERFERLMFEGTPGRTNLVFPSLVSFIGETGGGKSGLINLLIKGLDKGFRDYAAPVVGASQNQQQPTSGDVHLYVDPMSFGTDNPKLYVDCEGLNGGDNIPQSLNAIARAKKLLNGIQRTIFGAEGKGREFIVSQVYSRILYTFSDVVVFVLVNTRTIEKVIHQLLEWGSESVCHVSNQPVLPHAVIALNKCTDLQLDDQDNWDKTETTKWLLSALDNNLYNIPKFSKYITAWEDSRPEDSPRERATTMSLLRQFYGTVTAIRFPGFHDGRGPTKLMVEQVKTLYQHIDDCCTSSRERKHRHRRCFSADQITPYFGHAFEHFTSKIGLSAPFDFVKASLKEQPVQRDFKDNIVYLACGLIQHARKIAVGEIIEPSPRLIKTSECPLDGEHEANTFLRLQSPDMGTRVLALDGGGVRGIVELVALQELEARLGGVPIASFFDLIVGTSTGGIIAAGLAKKGWSSSECATMFKKLCNSAFISTWFDSTMRWTTGIPVLEKIGRYWFPRFQTEGLENALIQAFGRNAKLFGTAHDLILANYNRAEPADMSYRLIRQTNPDTDWKIWQAARASSAAPTWFASYVHESLDTSYVDGGLHHNNPVAIDHISNSLNSEKIWAQFQRDHQVEGDNILRLNSLLDPPLAELHEVTKVAALEEKAQEFWRSRRESKELLNDVANRLVSRSFYFEVKHTSTMKDCFSVTGEIRSRFSSLSETREISKIGRLFDKILTEDLSFPCFKIVQEGSRSEQTLRVKASVINEMISSNVFSLSEVGDVGIELNSSHSKCQVRLCLGDGEGHMISGFPRKLYKNGS